MTSPSRVPSIDAGLPASGDEWPAGVLEAAALFEAGDIIAKPPLFYFADSSRGVWAATRTLEEGSPGAELVDAQSVSPDFGIITSQTCDIGEIGFARPCKPWIQVAPVYDLSSIRDDVRSALQKNKGPIYLKWIPQLAGVSNGFWVADLRIEVPVEKSILVGRVPIKGFHSEQEQRGVLKRVSDLRLRPAWADAVVDGVQNPLLSSLKALRGSDRQTFDEIELAVAEVGARTDSMVQPKTLEMALFVDAPLSDTALEWWNSFTDFLRASARLSQLTVQAPVVLDLNECSVSKYRLYAPVPLTRYSPM